MHEPTVQQRDERKSASLAARNVKPEPGAEVVQAFGFAREILRSPKILQAGASAEHINISNPEHVPVFFLDGKSHHLRRAAIVKFFSAKAIETRHLEVMKRTSSELLQRLRASGSARLDELSFELAVAVASEIVGLTNSDRRAMAQRLRQLLGSTFHSAPRGFQRLVNIVKQRWYGFQFYRNDVQPAVRARQAERREDIISQTLDKGYSVRSIMIECMTYAAAGMVTTREFIVMVAWHLLERPELRQRYLDADEAGQLAILLEILRLEPVASLLYRRTGEEDMETSACGLRKAKSNFAIDLRAVNADEAVVGACPHMIDPERADKLNQNGTFMSFGDGPHRCPGWQVALQETRVFIDQLLRVPGIQLQRAPDMLWNAPLMSYELRNAIVTCERAT